MRRLFQLLFLYVRLSLQNVAAYRFDMFMRIGVSIVHVAAELLGVWTIFHNTAALRGWTWQQMVVLVGVYRLVAGGIRILIVPNMRRVLEEIREGTLDFVLLRPVNSQVLVSIREFVVWRVADVILGGTLALYGCYALLGRIPLWDVFLLVLTLTAAFVIVYSIWLMLATSCFWFIRVANIEMVFWNVFEAGRFPIVIYRPWVQWLLTFVVPLAFVTTIPAGVLVGRAGDVLTWAPLWALLLATVMAFLSAAFWRFGLRRYSGASA